MPAVEKEKKQNAFSPTDVPRGGSGGHGPGLYRGPEPNGLGSGDKRLLERAPKAMVASAREQLTRNERRNMEEFEVGSENGEGMTYLDWLRIQATEGGPPPGEEGENEDE